MTEHSASSKRWRVIAGMRSVYSSGENAMAAGRKVSRQRFNSTLVTEVAYDLQAGSYVDWARDNQTAALKWSQQVAETLSPWLLDAESLLEVGTGDGTTLAGVLVALGPSSTLSPKLRVGATDISWSRCNVARQQVDSIWDANIWASDLFHIPLASQSVDVVFTSHCLEPNGSREDAAIRELSRVARRAIVLIEPVFEFASTEAQRRMDAHGYVRDLAATAQALGLTLAEYRKLDFSLSPLNPSGCLVLLPKDDSPGSINPADRDWSWICPVSGTPLENVGDAFYSHEAGLAYPILQGIPVLRREHAIVASQLLPVK